MASLSPYTTQDLMDAIYVAVDNDPSSSSDATQDEWVARLRLINMGIAAWDRQDVIWNELWTLYTHPTPVTATNTFLITTTDYRQYPGAYLMFTAANNTVQYMDIINPNQAQQYINIGSRKAYITGNAAVGFTINFTFTPSATDSLIGNIMALYYYKSPAKMVDGTSKPEMSDPQYLVSYVAAKKNLFNGRTAIAEDFLDDAEASMDNMRIRNEFVIPGGDNRIPDVDITRDGDSFGL